MNDRPGATFGKYRLIRKIGEGAFGRVYEAVLPGPMGFTKRVAVKLLHGGVDEQDERVVAALVDEARIGGLLNHPNVVDILEFGIVDGTLFIAMEFVDGATLAELLDRSRERSVLLPRFAVVDLSLQICRGLDHVHGLVDNDGKPLGLVHRDLKPSNIIIATSGVAKVGDFGVAKARINRAKTTMAGVAKGTPRYMSPEQVAAETRLTGRSDLYSLGLVMFEMVAGRVLLDDPTVPQLVERILRSDHGEAIGEAEELIPGFGSILTRCLAQKPADRYESAASVANDLLMLARRYPREAEISAVVAQVLPTVSRGLADCISDTSELHLGGSDPFEAHSLPPLPATATARMTRKSGEWGAFTHAFSGEATVVGRPAGEQLPSQGEMVAPPTVRAERVAGPRITKRNPIPLRMGIVLGVTAACVVLVALLVGTDLLGPGGDREAEPVAEPAVELAVEPVAELVAEPTAPTPEPEVEPATPIPEIEAATPIPEPEPQAGTVSLSWRPWGQLMIDGRQRDLPVLADHPLEGGTHTITLICPSLEDKQKQILVEIDGQHVHLGCWNFREDRFGCD